YRGGCPDTHVIANFCRTPKIVIPASRASSDERVIDKHCPMGNETVVTDGNAITNKSVGLNPAAFPNHRAPLNLDERADESAVSNHAPVEINRFNDDDILAEFNVDNSDRSKLRSSHQIFSHRPFDSKGRARSRMETTV